MNRFMLVFACCLLQFSAMAQSEPPAEREGPVYTVREGVEIPLTLAATGYTLYGFSVAYSKDASTPQQIARLNRDDINSFDRWATRVYHEKAAPTSDLLFYGSMPLPALLFLNRNVRREAGKVALIYLQTMAATGVLYTSATMAVDRYRPYTYNVATPQDMKLNGGAKNTFFAGHVALVGTATFFAAKVYSDFNPNSSLRPWLFAGAGLATGATGYLRHRSGRHFPSDILIGTAVGTLNGILIPHAHKRGRGGQRTTFAPYSFGREHGLAMRMKL